MKRRDVETSKRQDVEPPERRMGENVMRHERGAGLLRASVVLAVALPGLMLAAGMVPEWASGAWSILLLVVGFSLVIFVHELGHFLAAKWADVRVERFAVGFGKELVGFTRGETRYSLNVLPLGGYVKMLGQEDFVIDKSGELKVKADPRSFSSKPISKRMVIISAGVIMNLIFAAVAFAIVVMVGRWQPPPVVGQVIENSPAGRAGLQTGDRIVAVNGSPIETFGELSSAIVLSDPDEVLVFDVIRDGKRLDPPPRILPEFKPSESIRQVGIGSGMNRRVALASIHPKEDPPEDELRENDELFKLVVPAQDAVGSPAGKEIEIRDLAVLRRALVAARGAPVEVIVKRPVDPSKLTDEAMMGFDSPIETREVRVKVRTLWAPLSCEQGDMVTGSLLGLVPRLTVLFPDPEKPLGRAGVKTGDVVTRIGSNAYPNYATFRSEIEHNAGQPVAIEVRRPYAGNHGLSGATVAFCCRHRERFIAAGRRDVAAAARLVKEEGERAGLAAEQIEQLVGQLRGLRDGPAWRRWFENVDVHKVGPIVPKRPFSLIGPPPPATIDGNLRCLDEDHIVVADVLAKLGNRASPAKTAGIPVGAVITAVDGEPVRHWYELSEKFRLAAGRTVELSYRVADEEKRARMAIPECVFTALDLPAGSRITAIDGKSTARLTGAEGKSEEVSLPDWRAVESLLAGAVGRTVNVEWVTWDGERHSGPYAVRKDNVDPWLARVMFPDSFMCYPLVEKHVVRNPVLAAWIGFRQAYQATVQTIQSVRHMLFTRQVGLNKVSGPVGIFRWGAKFADNGVLSLLWFLAVISANLAVINFLPMPIVDGGLLLFLILEKIRGEPVSIKTQVATQVIGIALIATVFVLVTYQDIKNWITGT